MSLDITPHEILYLLLMQNNRPETIGSINIKYHHDTSEVDILNPLDTTTRVNALHKLVMLYGGAEAIKQSHQEIMLKVNDYEFERDDEIARLKEMYTYKPVKKVKEVLQVVQMGLF